MHPATPVAHVVHPVTGVRPFDLLNCADLGDVGANPASLDAAMSEISGFFQHLRKSGKRALSAGGDHLCTLPVLRGLADDTPLGFVQFDAHSDLFDGYFGGQKFTHGTPFRRAIEENLIDPRRYVMIGIRGTAYNTQDIEWGEAQGVRVIRIEELMQRGCSDVMAEAREILGTAPAYCTFDIDVIDPAYAPGTGTPEIGGITSFQAQELVRGLAGVPLVGADVVEVSPPFDPSGVTAWVGASLLFELLCVLATNAPNP